MRSVIFSTTEIGQILGLVALERMAVKNTYMKVIWVVCQENPDKNYIEFCAEEQENVDK